MYAIQAKVKRQDLPKPASLFMKYFQDCILPQDCMLASRTATWLVNFAHCVLHTLSNIMLPNKSALEP